MSNEHKGIPIDAFAAWLDANMARPGVRASLRAGGRPATEERSYPLLGRWWGSAHESSRDALRLASAAIAESGVRNAPDAGRTLGRASRALTARFSDQGIENRLMVAYRQPIARAHSQFSALLRMASGEGVPVHYASIVKLYLYWGYPRTRKELLTDYFSSPESLSRTAPDSHSEGKE